MYVKLVNVRKYFLLEHVLDIFLGGTDFIITVLSSCEPLFELADFFRLPPKFMASGKNLGRGGGGLEFDFFSNQKGPSLVFLMTSMLGRP